MAYSDFSLNSVKHSFDLFAQIEAIAPSALLKALKQTIPLVSAINTQKARSKLIIAPILLGVRQYQVSLFSGIDFNVAPEKGLAGFCDFILSRASLHSLASRSS
jgi:hypothetical protein